MSKKWTDLIKKKIVLLDGATGTILQKRGMPVGVAPEIFCLEHPDIIQQLQAEYVAAGADILYTPTFGANRVKLKNYGLEKKTVEINQRLAQLTLERAHRSGRLVAGDVGPTGIFYEPFGETPFETGIDIFAEQIRALSAAGVDLIVIETQLDIQEARIALLAAQEACRLPVMVCMTFTAEQRTLTGSDPLTCLNILQSLGADVFGVNCSSGPKEILEAIKSIAGHARIPLLVKPNAGLPTLQHNQTVFPMQPEEFASYAPAFQQQGISLIGGCCGTTPQHMQALSAQLHALAPQVLLPPASELLLSSPRQTLSISSQGQQPIRVVGERINPTGQPDLQADLQAGRLDLVKKLAQEQKAQGADILDVNVGAPGVDEKAMMVQAVMALAIHSDLPLCIDSSQPEVLEAAVRYYPGRVLLNSLSGEQAKMKKLIPCLKRYGPAFIVLPLDDHGISETWAERQRILDHILAVCAQHQISPQQAVVDGLTLTISAHQDLAQLTLETIRYAAKQLGLNTILGLSNISFGLPGREHLNAAYLAMAAAAGLSLVISHPGAPYLMTSKRSADVLVGRDQGGRHYLQDYIASSQAAASAALGQNIFSTPAEAIRQAILQGNKEEIVSRLQTGIEKGLPPLRLINEVLIPVIQTVGEKYQQKEFYLPQLVAAAEAMDQGMKFLFPLLRQEEQKKKGVIVLATVKGDIHEIGKQIVGLMLRNHGYEVIDLGKSVDEETIVQKALEYQADFIGLSALMTTTMLEMRKVMQLIQKRALPIKVIVGGAVVTQKFADQIHAHGYAADARATVEVVDRLLKPVT